MVLKFAANLNFLFTEGSPSLSEKIRLAYQAGFHAVEIPFPTGEVNDVIKAKTDTGIEVSLINIALGTNDLRLGSASIPGAEETFKQQLSETTSLAKALGCGKIHIMSGLTKEGSIGDYLKTYKNNLSYAAKYLENEGLIGVIEPINKYALPSYFLNCYQTACVILRELDSKNLRLLMDIYHLQHIRGDISNAFKDMGDIIGHIQIAQIPHRHEPDVPGELDFSYVLSLIEQSGYDGWIGCEYKPKTTTIDGLRWITKYGAQL